jgi:thiol-disulfide isomerase/thioredoxin
MGLILTIILSVIAGSATAQDLERYDRCLNYFSVGPSGCVPDKGVKTKPAPKQAPKPAPAPVAKATSTTVIPIEGEPVEEEVAEAAPPGPPSLDERIDEFMESHGKPPREFVAFHLEPTLENALKWVHAYNDMLERQRLLTYAWSQAERLYDESVAGGSDPSVLNAEGALPPVPDYGVELAQFPNPRDKTIGEKLPNAEGSPAANANPNITMPVNQVPELKPGFLAPGIPAGFIRNAMAERQNGGALGASAPQTSGIYRASAPLVDGRIGGDPADGVIQLSYYFSAECPYCQKFQPGFQEVIQSLGDKVAVTCIDMTPSGQSPSNIAGKVDCEWRSIERGELQRMGIQRTPTVVINRGSGQALERVSGYVEPLKLKEHLLTGAVR